MLSYLGYLVLPATGPQQALSLFADNRERIDLLITDHTMPRLTGLQLARKINALQPDRPIILCSGYSESVSPEEAEQAGVRRFLAKLVDMRMLAIAIQELLPERNREWNEDTDY
ncbi:MAG: response regulator [Desulfobulbus sp.]|jgi:CheY-like chemotaxis protein|nr:response regulator [Desulfobulbus sp.]